MGLKGVFLFAPILTIFLVVVVDVQVFSYRIDMQDLAIQVIKVYLIFIQVYLIKVYFTFFKVYLIKIFFYSSLF